MFHYRIFITTRFEAWHRWLEAPDHVEYLRNYHRHIFHVRIEWDVHTTNREEEFITLKQKVDEVIRMHFEGKRFELSCEQIAESLLKSFGAYQVEVSEDGENGAIAFFTS